MLLKFPTLILISLVVVAIVLLIIIVLVVFGVIKGGKAVKNQVTETDDSE